MKDLDILYCKWEQNLRTIDRNYLALQFFFTFSINLILLWGLILVFYWSQAKRLFLWYHACCTCWIYVVFIHFIDRWMSQSPSGNFTHSLAIQNVYWFNEIFFMSWTNPLLTRIARALSYYQIAWLKKCLMKRIESNGLSFARWHIITLPKNIWISYLLLIVFVQYTSD